jgi:thiamine biosynthesis lipoprotein
VTSPFAVESVDSQAVTLTVEAMATGFELVYWGPRAAGEEALGEIVRIESRLSATDQSSDVAWINVHAGLRAVKVEPRTFSLLERCTELCEETDGAFDITIGPFLQASVSPDGSAVLTDALADARARIGSGYLHLDPQASTIRFGHTGMRLDLSAVATGYAIDAATAILRAHGVQAALLHGGTGSASAIGRPPSGAWRIMWEGAGASRTFVLRDSALSVSAPDGQTDLVDGCRHWHVIDPVTGLPVDRAQVAIVSGACSLECEALSTALLVRGRDWLPALRERFPGYDGDLVRA